MVLPVRQPYTSLGHSKSQRISKLLKWFKNYIDFPKWVASGRVCHQSSLLFKCSVGSERSQKQSWYNMIIPQIVSRYFLMYPDIPGYIHILSDVSRYYLMYPEGWIWPIANISGVASGRVCTCSLRSRLVTDTSRYYLTYSAFPPDRNRP